MTKKNGTNPAIQPPEDATKRRTRGTHVSLDDPDRARRVEAFRARVEAEARERFPGAKIDTRAAVATLVELGLDAADQGDQP